MSIEQEVKDFIRTENGFRSFILRFHQVYAQSMVDSLDREMTKWLEKHKDDENSLKPSKSHTEIMNELVTQLKKVEEDRERWRKQVIATEAQYRDILIRISDITSERDTLLRENHDLVWRIGKRNDDMAELNKQHHTQVTALKNDLLLANRRFELCQSEVEMLHKYIGRHCVETERTGGLECQL
jgi:hypothetical protein